MARFQSRVDALCVGVAALGLVLITASSSAANANPSPHAFRTFGVPAQRADRAGMRGSLTRRHPSYVVTPTSCTSDFNNGEGGGNGDDYFVGISDSLEDDYAGGVTSAVLSGNYNEACDQSTAIGTGDANVIAYNGQATYSFIGGGQNNAITASGGFVGDGYENETNATNAFIGAGSSNVVNGMDSFVGAGLSNAANGSAAFVGSGYENVVNSKSDYSTIGGGYKNIVSSGFEYASVLGGYENTAKGEYAAVPGGYANSAAGVGSFAAGYQAEATHNGSFVWSDYDASASPLKDAKSDQFVVRASGGFTFYSNEALTSGVSLTSGSGTWANLSDRNAKTGIVPLDDASILAKVAALPIDRWSYKSEKGVQHVGPMAQDFYAAFGTGVDDHHITSIDEDGVALAAIKALHDENERLRNKLNALEAKVDRLARTAGSR
jgi:hypothetical protein